MRWVGSKSGIHLSIKLGDRSILVYLAFLSISALCPFRRAEDRSRRRAETALMLAEHSLRLFIRRVDLSILFGTMDARWGFS